MTNPAPPVDDARVTVRNLREAQQLVALIGLGDMNAAVDLRNRALAAADMIERLLSRVPSEEATDWRGIETAPWEFGKPVLLWKESTKEHYVAARVSGANGPGWCTPDGFEIFHATHWQPLPLAPITRAPGAGT